jgi:hypothetical protein
MLKEILKEIYKSWYCQKAAQLILFWILIFYSKIQIKIFKTYITDWYQMKLWICILFQNLERKAKQTGSLSSKLTEHT